ncbi:MAG TPA: hypothetical protein VGH40_04520 [Roseiarcus sp.]|jgi:predicted ATPase
MLDWSYDLLPESERVILRRLSVFAEAFTLEAAQIAAGDILERDQAAEIIASLVAKSLIAVETNPSGALYRIPAITRAYVHSKMVDSGERNALRNTTRSRFENPSSVANSCDREIVAAAIP